MPIAGIAPREGPLKPGKRESLVYMSILVDVEIVVEIDECVSTGLHEDQCDRRQQQAQITALTAVGCTEYPGLGVDAGVTTGRFAAAGNASLRGDVATAEFAASRFFNALFPMRRPDC